RSGTLNVPGIAGMGKACELAMQEIETESARLKYLRDLLEQRILQQVPATYVNGHRTNRLPHITNISFDGLDGEQLLLHLNRIAVSSGSACSSASVEPSYVLKVLGLSDTLAYA